MSASQIKVAVIGGSGVYKIAGVVPVQEHQVETPFGRPSGPIVEAVIKGKDGEGDTPFYFLPRHGVGHVLNPSEVNYRANIWALKKMGVNAIVSISAVGSLKEELPPKMFVLPTQFIDWTKGLRARSFFEKGFVGHVSVANPVDANLHQRLKNSCQAAGIEHSVGGSYICIEGPQFSTKAESAIYRSFGASVIGMTNVPEAFLAKEAGIAYATAAMVTDYDCWKEEHCTLEEVMRVMGTNYLSAQKLLLHLIPDLVKNPIVVIPENENVIVTASELQNGHHQEILNVLQRKN